MFVAVGRRIGPKRAFSWAWAHTFSSTPPPPPPSPAPPPFSAAPLFSTCHAPSYTDRCNSSINLNNVKRFYVGSKRHYSGQALAEFVVDGIVDIPLAQTGEGIAECELLKWFVQEGDEVDEFQPLCEVQSDKATIEITSRYKGKVARVLYAPGDIVKVGETLLKMVIGESQGQILAVAQDVLQNAADSVNLELNESKKTSGVLATPALRHLAKQHNIDINDVHGTGKDGRILETDVREYFSRAKKEDHQHQPLEAAEFLNDKTVPLRGFQRTMVKTMSMTTKVPHFHYVEEINCNALVELKASFQENNAAPGIKHTFLPLLIKSLSMALTKYPWMNSCFNEDSVEVVLKGSHNIGIAMATPHGLVVPNIKNVQSLSILEITKELSRLQELASTNNLNPEDITGGTITLSNIGAIGGKFGAPLVNLPEVAIIAIGRIQKVPHFADDGSSLYPVSVMTINIGADHRVLDGATVARFCNEWKQYIEKPELLMLHLR